MKQLVGAMALGTAMVLAAQPAAAQLPSHPVYFSPKNPTGLELAVDLGRGLNDASGKNTAGAFRATLGAGPIGIGAGVGVWNPQAGLDRSSTVSYMGKFALRVLGGGLLPVSLSLQTGVGYTKITDTSTKMLTVPIGAAIGFSAPTPGFSFDPWFAARVQVTRTEVGTFDTANQAGVAFSAGANMNFLMGLGFHLVAEWERLPLETVSSGGTGTLILDERKPLTIGIGVHYNITIPGLPGVPLVPVM